MEKNAKIGFYQSYISEDNQTLEMLNKEHYILIVYVLLYWDYFVFPVYLIKMSIEVA